MAVVDEVVVTLKFNQLVALLLLAVFIEIVIIRTCQKGCNTIFATVIINHNALFADHSGCIKVSNDTGLHITVSAEQIGLTINDIRSARCRLRRHISVITGAIPVTPSRTISCPCTGSKSSVIKEELDTPISILLAVSSCKSGRIEVVPYIINLLPTANQRAIDGIVVLSVNSLQTGNGRLSAAITSELVAGSLEGMSGCGNGDTPFNNRVTNLAEGSAGVTVFGTSSSLIFKSYGRMNVSRTMCREVFLIHISHAGVHFRINMEFFIGEGAGGAIGKGNETLINVHLHILCPELVGSPVSLGSVAGNQDIGIEVQDTDGQLSQNGSATVVVSTRASNGDGSGIGFFCNRIGCSKAFCKLHMIELPMVNIVEVDHGLNRLNRLDVSCLKVHPINRTEGDSVKSCISGNKLNGGIGRTGLNLNHTNHNRLVACVIANFELDTVVTVCHGSGGGHNTVCEGGLNLNAVNVNLSGSGI